jgi:hypothetical protein
MSKQKFGLILLFVFSAWVTQVQAGASEEYKLKASMIRLLPMHIDWPENSDLHDELKPFVIAVIGKNPFGSILGEILKKTTLKNKKVKIRYISGVEDIAGSGCHLLFISKISKKKLSEIIAVAGDKPILTLADRKGCAEMGVHINFLVKENKLRFEINRQALRQSGLMINYHLLQLADRIIN